MVSASAHPGFCIRTSANTLLLRTPVNKGEKKGRGQGFYAIALRSGTRKEDVRTLARINVPYPPDLAASPCPLAHGPGPGTGSFSENSEVSPVVKMFVAVALTVCPGTCPSIE
jgi:hypothetical protein